MPLGCWIHEKDSHCILRQVEGMHKLCQGITLLLALVHILLDLTPRCSTVQHSPHDLDDGIHIINVSLNKLCFVLTILLVNDQPLQSRILIGFDLVILLPCQSLEVILILRSFEIGVVLINSL